MNDEKNVAVNQNTTNVNILPKPKPKKLSFGKKLLLWIIALLILAVTFKILFGSVFTYSDGERTGLVTKFSRKGYIFKTHEGTLKIIGQGPINLNNAITTNEEWRFSVVNEDVARQIRSMDQRKIVKLYYKEYYTRLFWRGDTKYFVYKIEELPDR